jgi:hypothetical protein
MAFYRKMVCPVGMAWAAAVAAVRVDAAGPGWGAGLRAGGG